MLRASVRKKKGSESEIKNEVGGQIHCCSLTIDTHEKLALRVFSNYRGNEILQDTVIA